MKTTYTENHVAMYNGRPVEYSQAGDWNTTGIEDVKEWSSANPGTLFIRRGMFRQSDIGYLNGRQAGAAWSETGATVYWEVEDGFIEAIVEPGFGHATKRVPSPSL